LKKLAGPHDAAPNRLIFPDSLRPAVQLCPSRCIKKRPGLASPTDPILSLRSTAFHPMEPRPSSERPDRADDDKGTSAHALERAKHDLEEQIERVVADSARDHGNEPLEVSLNFEEVDLPEGEENEADSALMDRIAGLVDDFHEAPAVSGTGVRVRRLTAIDSDGEVAVQVDYDYAGYE
jgi:hypothetical protein